MGTIQGMKKKRTLAAVADREKTLATPLLKDDFKAWRRGLDWTQLQAAEWLGVSVRTYESWESGARKATHSIGLRLRMQMMKKGT